MPTFYEFFAGGGMARAGLGSKWTCLFANDNDERKAIAYRENWKDHVLKVEDVAEVRTSDLPGNPDLIWASFPCQDLSLAGHYAGLSGARSGTFWPFWELIKGLRREQRQPRIVVLENVCGALTSHDGHDFRSLISSLRLEGYRSGALVIDAERFVPHSRPRLFIIGVSSEGYVDPELVSTQPDSIFHTRAVRKAHASLSPEDQASWLWWHLPIPPARTATLADIIVPDAPFHTSDQTKALLKLMLPLHQAKVRAAKKLGRRVVGFIYKRTRPDGFGVKAQRAEVRFDEVAGCLRTPGGGSSRQSILVVEGKHVQSRLLTPREAARLMGLPDTYVLPERYNEAYGLMGDGLVVPVVAHLAAYLLDPLLQSLSTLWDTAA